jgi:lipid A 3-O-deacylase
MFQRQIAAAMLFLAAAVCAPGAPGVFAAEDSAQLMVGAGVFGFGVNSEPNNAEARIAYRFATGFLGTDGVFRGFKPLVGFAAQTNGSQFGYVGLAAPFVFGADERWEFVVEGGPGLYRQGSSALYLGGTFEFHLGAGLNYAVTERGRLGIGIYHISNANIHAKNPGVNSILATWAFSLNGP